MTDEKKIEQRIKVALKVARALDRLVATAPDALRSHCQVSYGRPVEHPGITVVYLDRTTGKWTGDMKADMPEWKFAVACLVISDKQVLQSTVGELQQLVEEQLSGALKALKRVHLADTSDELVEAAVKRLPKE